MAEKTPIEDILGKITKAAQEKKMQRLGTLIDNLKQRVENLIIPAAFSQENGSSEKIEEIQREILKRINKVLDTISEAVDPMVGAKILQVKGLIEPELETEPEQNETQVGKPPVQPKVQTQKEKDKELDELIRSAESMSKRPDKNAEPEERVPVSNTEIRMLIEDVEQDFQNKPAKKPVTTKAPPKAEPKEPVKEQKTTVSAPPVEPAAADTTIGKPPKKIENLGKTLKEVAEEEWSDFRSLFNALSFVELDGAMKDRYAKKDCQKYLGLEEDNAENRARYQAIRSEIKKTKYKTFFSKGNIWDALHLYFTDEEIMASGFREKLFLTNHKIELAIEEVIKKVGPTTPKPKKTLAVESPKNEFQSWIEGIKEEESKRLLIIIENQSRNKPEERAVWLKAAKRWLNRTATQTKTQKMTEAAFEGLAVLIDDETGALPEEIVLDALSNLKEIEKEMWIENKIHRLENDLESADEKIRAEALANLKGLVKKLETPVKIAKKPSMKELAESIEKIKELESLIEALEEIRAQFENKEVLLKFSGQIKGFKSPEHFKAKAEEFAAKNSPLASAKSKTEMIEGFLSVIQKWNPDAFEPWDEKSSLQTIIENLRKIGLGILKKIND